MEKLKESTTHVVQFVADKQPSNKESIDLVPRTWLKLCTNKWMCYFPEKRNRLAQGRQMGKNVEKSRTTLEVMGSNNNKRSRYATI